MRTFVFGALLVRALNAQVDDSAAASSSTSSGPFAAGTGDDTTSDALASDASSSGLGDFEFPGPTDTDSASSTPFVAFSVGTADVILSTLSPPDSASASADVILTILDSAANASSTGSAVLFALDPRSSSSTSDDGMRFGSLPVTSTTSIPTFSSRMTSSRSISTTTSASRRAGIPAFAPLPVGSGGVGAIPGASATPSLLLNLPIQPGGLRPSSVPAVGKAKVSPSAKSAVGKLGSLSVENPGAGGVVDGLAVAPGGTTGGSTTGTSKGTEGTVNGLAAAPGSVTGGTVNGLAVSVGGATGATFSGLAVPAAGATRAGTLGVTGGTVSGLALGHPPSGINALGDDSTPDDTPDDDEDAPPRSGPPGWDGEDNAQYDGEDYDTDAYYGKQKAKYVGKGNGTDDCPSYCLHEPDVGSDDELPVLKKKKVKKVKKTKSKVVAPVDDSDDGPDDAPSDKLRRAARPQLVGFSWPTKQASTTPSDASATNDDDNDDDDDDAAPVKKIKVKKVKKKAKGKCPARCLGKAKTSSASSAPTTMVTSTTVYDSPASPPTTTIYDSLVSPPTTTVYDSPVSPPTTTVYDSPVSPPTTIPPAIVLPPGLNPGPPAAKNIGKFSNPGTGPDANQLANLCPATCNPMDPTANKCDITTTCVTTGAGRYYCACPAGIRFDGADPANFGLQFKVEGQPYVYGAISQACNTVCRDQTCSEVPVRQQCA